MTTSRNNTIMSWMAYTDFLSRLRIAAGILLPLNTRTLLLYPGGRDCIGAAGVDAYFFTPFELNSFIDVQKPKTLHTNSPIRKKFQLFSLITFISRKSTYFTIVVKKFPYRSLLCYPSATFGTT